MKRCWRVSRLCLLEATFLPLRDNCIQALSAHKVYNFVNVSRDAWIELSLDFDFDLPAFVAIVTTVQRFLPIAVFLAGGQPLVIFYA